MTAALTPLPGVSMERPKPAQRLEPAAIEPQWETAVRLQVFLDWVEFSPGKIDGRFNEYTRKALALYREAQGGPAADLLALSECDEDDEAAPDVSGLGLGSMGPVLIYYTVTSEDLESVGQLPVSLIEQEKEERLPYRNAVEALAEKFHTAVDFLEQLNPGMTSGVQVGDRLRVPNVVPFEYAAVRTLEGGEELREPLPEPIALRVDTRSGMLMVFEGQEMIAAYPVSVGMGQTSTPVGEWRVRRVKRFPTMRYDEAMLAQGVRSTVFHMLPPGPNNPLGVVWISTTRDGIGLHGTDEPELVGLVPSHGCVRLANWDIVRLARKVKDEVPVVVE